MDFIVKVEPLLESEEFHVLKKESQNSGSNSWENQENKRIKKKIVSSKKWSIKENEIYSQFILEHRENLSTENIRRKSKIFKQLSERMDGVKTAEQCRGHHKKFIETYETIDNIVDAMKRKKCLDQFKRLKLWNKRTFRQDIDEEKRMCNSTKIDRKESGSTQQSLSKSAFSFIFEESNSKQHIEDNN